jgi:hypothetical protein
MTYVYVVQDHDHEIRGVTSTLLSAQEIFTNVMSELMTSEEFQEYQRLLGDGEPEMWGPWIMVYEIDGGCVWSYETVEEIEDALAHGEQYDD